MSWPSSVVQDSLGFLKEVHSICYCLAHSPTQKAHVGIWIVEGVVFIVDDQECPIETLVE